MRWWQTSRALGLIIVLALAQPAHAQDVPASLKDSPELWVKVDEIIAACRADHETSLKLTGSAHAAREFFIDRLPATDQPLAKVVCSSWLEGLIYQLGKTTLDGVAVDKCRPHQEGCYQDDEGNWIVLRMKQ